MRGCQWELEASSPAWGVCLHGSLSPPAFGLAHVLWSGQHTLRSLIMSARTLHFITLTLSMVPWGWKRYQISWQLAVSCSPSPWSVLSAALNRSSWSRATNTTVRTLNGSLKQTVVSCWALVAALVFSEWKECYKDFPPSVLGLLSVGETLWDPLLCVNIENNVMLHLLEWEKQQNDMTERQQI